MLDVMRVLHFKSQLQVIIPHIQEMQSTAYDAKENQIAAYCAKALDALYKIELDLDKSKPFLQADIDAALKETETIEQ